MAELFDMKELEERVILVAVSTSDEDGMEASLDELEELAKSAGAKVMGRVIQKKDRPDPPERRRSGVWCRTGRRFIQAPIWAVERSGNCGRWSGKWAQPA